VPKENKDLLNHQREDYVDLRLIFPPFSFKMCY